MEDIKEKYKININNITSNLPCVKPSLSLILNRSVKNLQLCENCPNLPNKHGMQIFSERSYPTTT